MQAMLDRGQVDGVIRVLPGFARDIARGHATSVQVLLDGTNSNTASLVSGYASQVIARYSQEASSAAQRSRMVGGTMNSGGADRCAHAADRLARARLVQPRSQEPQLLHTRRGSEHHHAGDVVAHGHGHRPRKRDRHHGAIDGDARSGLSN